MQTICFSANTSWYLYNFRRDTIVQLIKRGYRVCCIAPEDDYSQRLVDELGVTFIPLAMDNSGNNPLNDVRTAWHFFQIYRQYKPVVVFHFTIKNNIYGTLAAKALSIPAVNNVSGLGTAFIHSGWVGRIVRGLYKISQPFAYRVFCQNSEDQALLIKHKLVRADRLTLLPGSGVDLNRFKPVAKAMVSDHFRFLYVGRMLGDKGLRELVAAFAMVKSRGIKAELKLVGFADAKNKSAITRQELCSWQEEHGVEWLGSSDIIEDVLARADCVVLPSYREGLPRSLLEACAMALPVIATDVPGCRSVVSHNKNGMLCQPKDPVSLAEAMATMTSLPEAIRQEMGRNGRNLVSKHFSQTLVVQAYLDVVEQLENGKFYSGEYMPD